MYYLPFITCSLYRLSVSTRDYNNSRNWNLSLTWAVAPSWRPRGNLHWTRRQYVAQFRLPFCRLSRIVEHELMSCIVCYSLACCPDNVITEIYVTMITLIKGISLKSRLLKLSDNIILSYRTKLVKLSQKKFFK